MKLAFLAPIAALGLIATPVLAAAPAKPMAAKAKVHHTAMKTTKITTTKTKTGK